MAGWKIRCGCDCLAVLLAFSFGGCQTTAEEPANESCPAGASCAVYEETSVIEDEYTPPSPEPTGSYVVRLHYLLSDTRSDPQPVEDALSVLAAAELDMTVELIPTHDVGDITVQLVSEEPLDLFLMEQKDALEFITTSRYHEIPWETFLIDWSDYLAYIPNVVEGLGDRIQAGYMGNYLAGLPLLGEEGSYPALIAREDILEQIGVDPASIELTAADPDSYDQLTELFRKAKSFSQFTVGLELSPAVELRNGFIDPLGEGVGVLLLDGSGSTEVVNWPDTALCQKLYELNYCWTIEENLGIYVHSEDIVNENDYRMMRGELFSYFDWVYPGSVEAAEDRSGRELCAIPLNTAYRSSTPRITYALCSHSENPEKAAIFYNWLFTSGEAKDLLSYGVEGYSWEIAPDGTASPTVDYYPDYKYYSNASAFLMPNRFAGHLLNGESSYSNYQSYLENLPLSPAYGFVFDPTPVQTELLKCRSTLDAVLSLIDSSNPYYMEQKRVMEHDGIDKVLSEKQRQLDEWLTAQEE